MPHEPDARVSLISNMKYPPSPAPLPPPRINLAHSQPNTSPSTAPSTHPCQSADHRFVKGNGHFSSEADTIVGFDNDEEAGPSRNGGNGHVDNHHPMNDQLDGMIVPRLASYRPDNFDLPPLIGSPTESQWLDLNAPNVSPATGAVIQSPTVPPLDLQSRLQEQQLLQHVFTNPGSISVRDFAVVGGPVQQPDHEDGAYPTIPGYDCDTESPEP